MSKLMCFGEEIGGFLAGDSPFVVCSTEESDINKKITLNNFVVSEGAKITIQFVHKFNRNSFSSSSLTTLVPTLSVNNGTTYELYTWRKEKFGGNKYGGPFSAWGDNDIISFIFSNNKWIAVSPTETGEYASGSGRTVPIFGNQSITTNSYDFKYGLKSNLTITTSSISSRYTTKTDIRNNDNYNLIIKYQTGSGTEDYVCPGETGNNDTSTSAGYYTKITAGELALGGSKYTSGFNSNGLYITNGNYYYSGMLKINASSIGYSYYMQGSSGIKFTNNSVNPSTDNTLGLGASDARWKQLYAGTSTISTSDERKKENIKPVAEKYKNIILNATPITYTLKNENNTDKHDRIHCGFSAQNIKSLMDENNITSSDFAAWCQDFVYNKKIIEKEIEVEDLEAEAIDGKYPMKKMNISYEVDDIDAGPVGDILSLRYEEFIPILTSVVQDLYNENKELKSRLNVIEKSINLSNNG